MNKILEKNLMSVRKEDKHIKPFFENEKLKIDNLKEIQQDVLVGVEEIGERKVLCLLKGEKPYQLDSLYNSEQLLNKWFGQFDNVNYRSRYLLFGLGNGMYARKLLKESGEQSVIVIIEPSKEIFETMMKNFDMSDILSSSKVILLIDGITKDRFVDVLNVVLAQEDLPGAVRRAYLNYPQIFEKEYEEYDDTIKRHINRLEANRSVMLRMGEHYWGNSFLNYPYLLKQKSLIALSRNLPKDIPAILVAAGPSLDKNAEILKKAKNRAFILAVDSAARALIKKGIVPDAMICIDALKSYKHFKEEEVQKIPMITNLFSSCFPLIMHSGDKYFLHDDNTYIGEIFKRFDKMLPQVAGGGSVATDGYALLERMQFSTIILVGLDLAYTNRQTHSEDSVRGETNQLEDNSRLQVEGINGDMIDTSYEFQIYYDWFCEEMRNNPKINVIDATEGGAKIEGTTILTLDKAIKKYTKKEVDIDAIMKEIPLRLTEKEQKEMVEHIHELPKRLEAVSERVDKVILQYKNMKRIIKSGKYKLVELEKIMKNAKKDAEKIENDPAFFYIKLTLQSAVEQKIGTNLFKNEEGKSEAETSIQQAIDYFLIMQDEVEKNINTSRAWIELAENKNTYKESFPKEMLPYLEGEL